MKKFKYGVIMLCFLFMIGGCAKPQEEKMDTSTVTPLLLEATKEGENQTLYLFGSIHAGEEGLYPLPDYVMDAYRKSDVVAVEFDLVAYEQDLDAQIALLANFVNLDGKKIQDYISEETYNKSVEILRKAHLYSPMFDYYTPMMWQMLLENAVIVDTNLEEQYGIDKSFLNLSKENQKEILELESAESQYNMLSGFDYDTQIHLLEQALDEYEDSKESLKTLYELYKKGNREELEKILFEEEEASNPYLEEYNEELITKRNKGMLDSLKKAMEDEKDIFCTVGLAHIIGEGGLADLLEEQGYTIQEVR